MLSNKTLITIPFTVLYLILLFYVSGSYYYRPWLLVLVYSVFFISGIRLHKKYINFRLSIVLISMLLMFLIIAKYIKLEYLNLLDFYLPIMFLLYYILSLLFLKSKKFKLFYLFIFGLINYFSCYYVYYMSTNYSKFGTYDGYFSYKFKQPIKLIDKDKKELILKENKTYVIDMWNKGCGVCFLKFPKFEHLKKSYSDKRNIEFFAVNVYESEKEIMSSNKLFELQKLDFNTFYTPTENSAELKTTFFPTTLVIKNGEIIFRGDIELLKALGFIYLND